MATTRLSAYLLVIFALTSAPFLLAQHADQDAAVDEEWESADLGLLIYARYSDSNGGFIEYRLKNIRRAEPSPDLFVIPANYDVAPDSGSQDPMYSSQDGRWVFDELAWRSSDRCAELLRNEPAPIAVIGVGLFVRVCSSAQRDREPADPPPFAPVSMRRLSRRSGAAAKADIHQRSESCVVLVKEPVLRKCHQDLSVYWRSLLAAGRR
jgi:hypothetical protein